MNSLNYFLVFFAVLNNGYGLYRKGQCPENKSLNNIDLNRFFRGQWHEIQITPFNFGDAKKCGVINFNALENEVRYTYTQQGNYVFSQLGIVYRSKNQVDAFVGFPGDDSESKLYVLDTDYENYGVLYTCSQESDSVVKERLFVLRRGNELKPDLNVDAILRKGNSDFSKIGSRLESCENLGKAKAADDCFAVDPVTDLSVYRFFNSKWYENNRTMNNDFNSNTTCGKFVMEHAPALPGDPELAIIDHRYRESDFNFIIYGNATTDENKKTVITFQYPVDTQESKYYVLYNNYETALVYSCAKEPNDLRERAWILDRDYNVSRETILEIEAAIDSQGSGFRERLTGMKYCEDIQPAQTCYNISPISNLDLDKLSKVTWNEVWKSKNQVEKENECTTVEYSYDEGRLNVTHQYFEVPRNMFQGQGDVTEDKHIINFQFPRISTIWERSDYIVVGTDYDNYAVVYNCWQRSMTEREERVWVLSRSRGEIPAKGREIIQSDEYLRNLMDQNGIVCQ